MEYKTPSRFIMEIPQKFLTIKEHVDSTYRDNFFQIDNLQLNNFLNENKGYGTKDNLSQKTTVPKREHTEKSHDGNGSAFVLKERVLHPKYGPGRIVKIEGSGDNIKLTISFGVTTKVFMEKYTPLEKLN